MTGSGDTEPSAWDRARREMLRSVVRHAKGAAQRSDLTKAMIQALGEESAEFCRVRGLRGGVLTIEVDSPPLFSELRGFRSEEVRNAINAALPIDKVAQIRFRMGGTGHI